MIKHMLDVLGPSYPLDIIMGHLQGFQFQGLSLASLRNEDESIRFGMPRVRRYIGLKRQYNVRITFNQNNLA